MAALKKNRYDSTQEDSAESGKCGDEAMYELILFLVVVLNVLFLFGTIAGICALAKSRVLKDYIQQLENKIDYLQKKLTELHRYVQEHIAPAAEGDQEESAPAPQDAAAQASAAQDAAGIVAEEMEERPAPAEESQADEAIEPPEKPAPSAPPITAPSPPAVEAFEPALEAAAPEAPFIQEEAVK
ncbi:MAG: hypothetical protein JXR73_02305, partial [Candidatus Omnitrophica bacterium]|nr:hypothetical protein [Candidatus Omnitrophota bacterium]